MAGDERTRELATIAAALAASAGVDLPGDLRLWGLAGGRPAPGAAGATAVPGGGGDPARALVDALEGRLSHAERRQGAHYTPAALADEVVALAAVDGAMTVADPSCGGGGMLLAAAQRLAARGGEPASIVRTQLFGADVDPLAVAVAEAALALWSGGVAPAPGHLVVGDPLCHGAEAWPGPPTGGFDRVVGNPPFQGQLAGETARDGAARAALRERFGAAVAPYVDTAALFLLAAVGLAAAGGRVALVQPQSIASARDAGPVRSALAARARLVDLAVPAGRPFAARVHVCVPVLEVGPVDDEADWGTRLARGRGVPAVDLSSRSGLVGGRAEVVAGFRQHYYALVGHVHEAGPAGPPEAALVTSGLLDVGSSAWGHRPVRFARRAWARPVVDVAAVAASDERMARWLALVRRPKVVVATQTRVVEAAADRRGSWVPCTPVVSVVPREPGDVDRLAAALCAPPVAAWVTARAAGSGLSPGALRLSAPILREVPLPVDADAWEEAAALLAAGDLARYAEAATAMHALPGPTAAAVTRWWTSASR